MIQLQSYAFTIVESALSDNGNFKVLGGGPSYTFLQSPTIPSVGVCEPGDAGGLNIESGTAWYGPAVQIGDIWPADQYSEVTLLAMDSATEAGILLTCRCSYKAQPTYPTWYELACLGVLGSAGTGTATLYWAQSGTGGVIGTQVTGLTFNVGDVIRFEVVGYTLYGYQNESLIVSGTDSHEYFNSGYPGVNLYNANTQAGTAISLWAAGANQAATPTFSLSGTTLTITSATSGGTIYYTTDGTNPTHSSSSISNGDSITAGGEVIHAFASVSDYADSPTASYAVPSSSSEPELPFGAGPTGTLGEATSPSASSNRTSEFGTGRTEIIG